MAFLSVVGLTACSDDEPKDSVKEIRMQVSAETGVMYAWGDDKKENPIECMLVKTEGDSEEWQPLGFNSIEGFTYIKGHEYYLSVKRTILANPPADGSDRTYSLIRILQDRLVTEPEIPVDEEITSEEDIEYQDLCPLVRNESHGPMFKDVVPEDEFTHITQSMQSGEEVRYALILANVYKKGLQKLFGCGLGGTYQQYYDKKRSPKRLHHDTDRSRNRL